MCKSFYFTVCALAIVSLLVACTGEGNFEEAVTKNREPMTFTAVREPLSAPDKSTRIADICSSASAYSSWTNGDKICVNVQSFLTGSTFSTICTLNANGSIANYSPQLYWQNTGGYSVCAWYSNIGDNPTAETIVDISDQSGGELPYVLRAEPMKWTYTGKGRDNVQLTFTHQLSKVMVRLLDAGGNGINPENVSLWIRNCYTSCTIDKGVVVPIGKADSYIKMIPPDDATGCYQANVIPDASGTMRQSYALEVKVGHKTTGIDLSSPVTFEKGKVYLFEVVVR